MSIADDSGAVRFALAFAMLVAVAGTISLPEVWLREGPTVAPPDWVFESQPSQLGEWVCVADDCVMARNSLVTNADGSVAWVINPDNPLTRLDRDDQGRDEDVRIASIQAVSGRIHVLLESGRVVTRTRDGTWRPGVGAFRESIAVSLVIAWLAGSAAAVSGWLRARRIELSTLAVAGVAAAVAHLPVTIWEHSTALSLSAAGALSAVLIGCSAVGGFLSARPGHGAIGRRS